MASIHVKDFIIKGIFNKALEETVVEYGMVDEDVAHSIIFRIMDLKEGGEEHVRALQRAIAEKIDPAIQTRYYSLVTKYFRRAAGKKLRKPILMPKLLQGTALTSPAVASDGTNWEEIFRLCEAEQYERQVEAGENRLSPEWTPDDEAA